MHTVTYPSGVVESWDHTAGYKQTAADGTVVEERALTADEATRLTEFEHRDEREQSRTQLHTQARAALTQNAVYRGKVDGGTAVQADHIANGVRLTRQVDALIRLVVGSDLLDGENP